jgi:hypothetical protein
MKLRIQATGYWKPSEVITCWVDNRRPIDPEIENIIQKAWDQAQRLPGKKLFDGPMCRLEQVVANEKLELDLSTTSYRIFWGTNLNNAGLAERFGAAALANPIGLSCALESTDGFLLLGRRNSTVAYYPSRVHPFAGALEPSQPVDVFAQVRRELSEELGFTDVDIAQIACIGVVEDAAISQPELIFWVKSKRTRAEIEYMLIPEEHESVLAVHCTPNGLQEALKDPALTPVAQGTILLLGRHRFGVAWFDAAEHLVNLGAHEPA